MKQEYYCEECDLLATCTIPRGTGAYEAINIVGDAHAKKSPACAFMNSTSKVRVRAPDCSAAEWRKVREDARAAISPKELEARAAIKELLSPLPHFERRRILITVAEKFGYKIEPVLR